MSIMTKPPEWHSLGSEPPENKKQVGWEVDERPPASWFNWLFHRIYQSLLELAQAITSHSEKAAPHVGHERTENKGQPGGYAGLDDDGHIPAPQLGNVIGMEEHGNEWHSEDFQTSAEAQAHVNDKSNPHAVTAAQVGLGNVQNYSIATQAAAEEGAASNKYMTPQRTKQAIAALQAVKSVAGKTGAVTLTASDLPSASTSAKGVVQLSTSTSSTSTSLAATPSAVKAAYDLANGKADSIATVSSRKAGYAVYAP